MTQQGMHEFTYKVRDTNPGDTICQPVFFVTNKLGAKVAKMVADAADFQCGGKVTFVTVSIGIRVSVLENESDSDLDTSAPSRVD